MKNYIHIKNKYNNHYTKQTATPKEVNSYYDKLNNLASPINKRNNYIKPSKKRNIKVLNYNKLNFAKEEKSLNELDNKNIPLKKYSNLLSLINKQNKKQDIDYDIKDNNHKKNISLNKLQEEIKIIQLKLRSDIIKNKIKLLRDISNDSKYTMNKIKNKSNDIYIFSENNKIFEKNKFNIKENNFNLDKKCLIKKRSIDRKKYKIRNYKINNTDSKKVLLPKRNINLNEKNNYNYENNTFYLTKKINYFNNIYNTNNNSRLNSEQNNFKKTNIINNEYESNIKSRIDKIMEKRKKMNSINRINFYNDLDINNKRYFARTPDNPTKSVVNEKINFNINSNRNSKKNLINDKKDFLKFSDKSYTKKDKPRSYNDNSIKIKKRDNNKKSNEYLSKNYPQGFFDNFFINNYSINNINNTTIYNNNKDIIPLINDSRNFDNNYYKVENKKIFEKNDRNIKDKKTFENQKEKKVIDFSFINNGNNKKEQIIENNKNNSIINIVNFTFNPVKISYEQEIYIPKAQDIKNNEKNNENDQNIIIVNNIKENIINNDKTNNIKEDIIQNEHKNKKIEKKYENKTLNIDSIINHNNNIIDSINSNIIKDVKVEPTEEKKLSTMHQEELKQKAAILNNSFHRDRQIKIDNNNKSSTNKKTITFNEIKIIIKYYQNDYIKKSFIFSENDFKKIKHNYLSTKEHIQNLKKKNNIKSILLVKEDKNKIKNERLNLALFKLNELISEVKTSEINKTDENNKIKQDNKPDNKIKVPFIKKNINFIKKIEEYSKKGINYRCLSKSEMKLLKKKKNIICYKFHNNPQNFFSEKLCDNIIKSFDFNLDDSDATKMSKKRFINKKLGNIKIENELNNSFKQENRAKNLSFI